MIDYLWCISITAFVWYLIHKPKSLWTILWALNVAVCILTLLYKFN
jgi:hypothetical protein